MHEENIEDKLYGIVAEFDDPDALVAASQSAYDKGYRVMEGYSPFPIHGIDDALGIPETKLPRLTLAAGLTGACTGFALQSADKIDTGFYKGECTPSNIIII